MLGNQKVAWISWAVLLGMALAWTGCGKSDEAGEAVIELDPIIKDNPQAEPPQVLFPAECQQEDASVNKFIEDVLKASKDGDYDKFCSYFGTSQVPPSQDNFKRIWHGVREIRVCKVHFVSEKEPQYFIHATVKLRQPDARKRLERDIVIRVFKELDQWRLSGAPPEIARKVIRASSQPASAPAATNPADKAAAGGALAAPRGGLAVYKAGLGA